MTKMTVIIDRFEGEMAICEKIDRSMISVPRSKLPQEAREGDVVVIEGKTARIDQPATAARKRAAEEKLGRILKES
jgi:hypothetical protein